MLFAGVGNPLVGVAGTDESDATLASRRFLRLFSASLVCAGVGRVVWSGVAGRGGSESPSGMEGWSAPRERFFDFLRLGSVGVRAGDAVGVVSIGVFPVGL